MTTRYAARQPELESLVATLDERGYRLRSTNTFYNLVYPFYVREGQV